jgi:hypothetical protein
MQVFDGEVIIKDLASSGLFSDFPQFYTDIEFLTCGNDNLTYEQNCIIFKYVFDYIKCSKRFLIV